MYLNNNMHTGDYHCTLGEGGKLDSDSKQRLVNLRICTWPKACGLALASGTAGTCNPLNNNNK